MDSTSRKNILFVNDEPDLLEDINRTLHNQSYLWNKELKKEVVCSCKENAHV